MTATIPGMNLSMARFRTVNTPRMAKPSVLPVDSEACSWDAMCRVYREQAARGVAEAVRGLELIEQDRWPSSGSPRRR